ncbi:MAG: thio(seleno)oxazole modification radical SAM maturase SbtM [Oceanidesulfovibrio sp.]
MDNPESNRARIFPATRRVLGAPVWTCLEKVMARQGLDYENLPELISEIAPAAPAWAQELAMVELARELVRLAAQEGAADVEAMAVNPALQLLPVCWRGLPGVVRGANEAPRRENAHILVWSPPGVHDCEGGAAVRVAEASGEDLLALKIVAEDMPLEAVAREAQVTTAVLRQVLRRTADRGLLLAPPSLLVRDASSHPRPQPVSPDSRSSRVPADVFASEYFTLQWHITQRCDLHCKHCYDRSEREDVDLGRGLGLLDELARFCEERRVQGQATFTGGNPILHPHFLELYAAAAERGLSVALLANPCGENMLDAMLDIAAPSYFQVSLEGLEEHNDAIRGPGHFRRTMAFLDLLAERGVPSQVMLTLTRGNQGQVIPLARALEGRVGTFTFNRLAPVGEGAALACANTAGFSDFLREYLAAAEGMDHIGLKDNLFNALPDMGQVLHGGCTGHGCGAAFNFFAVLSDGAAHACRKMASPIGNVYEQGLAGVYDGDPAAAYRRGSTACAGCDIRAVCGGCMAVVKGLGQDPFTERDPYCFYGAAPSMK